MLLSFLTSWVVIGALLCSLIPRSFASVANNGVVDLYEELGGPAFRTPKNILFGVTLGGSSHASWVIRILNELANRGHNVTFAGTDYYLRFAQPFPHINIVDLGESVESKMDITNMQNPRTWEDRRNEIQVDIENYNRIFERLQETIKSQEIDVVLADSYSTACFDAARQAEIPSIVMMLINLAQDALAPYVNKEIDIGGEPTVEHMPLSFRFYKKFIYPFDTYMNLNSLRKKYNAQRERAMGGRPVQEDPHVYSLKIVNSFYGIEEARPMGPLVEMIGPIFNGYYSPMAPEIQNYLETHHRVLYIAFGQFAAFEPTLTERVLVEALEILEAGDLIDGFLWGVGSSTARLPNNVTTSSGKVYNLDELWSEHPDARLIAWAPQFPILRHPSVITFLSHGGGMSVFESLYAGVRTVIRPFFGDQPAHALHYEREQLGGFLDLDRERPFDVLRQVIEDKEGVFQKNTNRYQAIAQLRSQHAASRGADLVEEVLFASRDGILPHRVDIARKVSYLKANDYDLYLYLFCILLGVGLMVRLLYRQLAVDHKHRQQQKKLKIV